MPFILIVIGFILVYLGLKMDKKSTDKTYNGQFNSILDNKFIEGDINKLNESIKDLKDRTENIEQSMILIGNKLENAENASKVIEVYDTAENNNLNVIKIEDEILEKVEEQCDINTRVYSLSDSGKTVEEIASLLKIGKGEILLRLGLKNQKKQF